MIASQRLALVLAAVLACAAQASAAVPWCAALPFPGRAHAASCRVLEVRAPHRTLHLAVAADEPNREHGLMNVPAIRPGDGMLFAFADGDQTRYFWMKNTIAALDMIFVASDGTVTSVAADVPATKPGTPDADVATRKGDGRFVIELGAGDARRQGIARGTHLAIPDLPAT